MNEEPPSPFPPPLPAPEPLQKSPPDPPNFWLMFFVGILLLIISGGLCAATRDIAPFSVGVLFALVSLFFQGYRGVFVGFVGSLGVVFLGLAIMCGAMMPHNL